MVPITFIWWIYHFWARFWPYFNFVDFRAYFGPFSLVNRDRQKMADLLMKMASNQKMQENRPTLKFNFTIEKGWPVSKFSFWHSHWALLYIVHWYWYILSLKARPFWRFADFCKRGGIVALCTLAYRPPCEQCPCPSVIGEDCWWGKQPVMEIGLMLFLLFSCLNDETAVNDEEVVVGVDENESGLASKLVRGKRTSPTKLRKTKADICS